MVMAMVLYGRNPTNKTHPLSQLQSKSASQAVHSTLLPQNVVI
jgi:hypothetical protein